MPESPQLPMERVKASRPFVNVGIDYFGPMYIKTTTNNKKENKVWGAVFVCMVSRAVHLELVSSCSALDFLKAFRRFISRRGTPEVIISDNGTNFKLASKALKQLWKVGTKDDELCANYTTKMKCKHF
jgi:hypothetical protein